MERRKDIVLVIDALNIRAGGGLTHLRELTNSIKETYFSKIYVIGQHEISDFPENGILKKIIINLNVLEKVLYLIFPAAVIRLKTKGLPFNLIFSPAGTYYSKKNKYVSMSQNMLVFDETERNRFPLSLSRFRYNFLELIQKRSFSNASGNIFISSYAHNFISKKYSRIKKVPNKIIYHGVSGRFRAYPKVQKEICEYSDDNPFRILYVSIINFYKHQDSVIKAVKIIKKREFPIHLDLAGPINPRIKSLFEESMKGCELFVTYHGAISYQEIHSLYKVADLFIFASTCENMPNILIEAMSSGLPVLCSFYGPMPEILKDAGIYCDPTDPTDIANKLEAMIKDKNLRKDIALKSYNLSADFTWDQCSKKTITFLEKIATDK